MNGLNYYKNIDQVDLIQMIFTLIILTLTLDISIKVDKI